jgi:hypothetical protein
VTSREPEREPEPERKTARITIRITPSEKARIQRHAGKAQRKEADWARLTLLAACTEPPCSCGHEEGEHGEALGPIKAWCNACLRGGEDAWRHHYTPNKQEDAA